MMLLVVNGGSSSIRFALFDQHSGLRQRRSGKVERIGTSGATLTMNGAGSSGIEQAGIAAGNFSEAFESLLSRLEENGELGKVVQRFG